VLDSKLRKRICQGCVDSMRVLILPELEAPQRRSLSTGWRSSFSPPFVVTDSSMIQNENDAEDTENNRNRTPRKIKIDCKYLSINVHLIMLRMNVSYDVIFYS
jgi:hypothetical protein